MTALFFEGMCVAYVTDLFGNLGDYPVVTFLNDKIARNAAFRGATRLAELVKPDGTFTYQYLYGKKGSLAPDYELHRHFCAGWALCHLGSDSEGHAFALNGENTIVSGFRTFSMPFDNEGRRCFFNKDKVEISVCGLALFAANLLTLPANKQELLPLARAVGDYILSQRVSGGDFIHLRHFPSLEQSPLAGNYSTAQALLGLFSLSQMTGNADWAAVAIESLSKLATKREPVLPYNHWATYCLEQAFLVSQDGRWYDQAKANVQTVLESSLAGDELNSCWLACNCEALLAWMRMVEAAGTAEADRELYAQAYSKLKNMLRKLVRYQTKDGGFVYKPGTSLVQIDFIHHAVVVFYEFSRMNVGARI